MKVSKIILIIVVALSLIFWGTFFVNTIFGQEYEENFLNTAQEGWNHFFENTHSDNKKYQQALHYQNESGCEKIKNADTKAECREQILIQKILNNTTNNDCNSIENENRKSECLYLMYEKTAIESENKKMCLFIADTEIFERCKEGVDGKIFSEILKNNTSISPEKCEILEGNFWSECVKLIKNHNTEEQYLEAIKSQNLILCKNISDENISKKCVDEITYQQSKKIANPLLCENIENSELKNNCLTESRIERDSQIFETATSTNNSALCEKISDTEIKNRCYDIITLSTVKKTKNTDLCHFLKNTEHINLCQKIGNI